ncbi:Ferredoxin subunit of nitrite reductase or a ring-hydroxylating dioxygenase [Lentzea fradiae]|uniref:Cytochrome bc1 complex Rieske iron-sulfur subunit n=1 Tax=Lentzea fradiae TaxID=200378 RepID=A0A1G8AFG8_9PSEU|nr:Rieske (2Fe-2S) protein [Lentzea fradiae]SDH19627.1 Ferredoxin subunit of nitrite reductase or a ring-hydroxylating dioxygenase [Lentzea fradiae]
MNTESPVTRRTALCGIVVALAVPSGLVTACSSGSSGTTTPDQDGSQPGQDSSGGGGALVALADVPEGGGAVVDGAGGKKIVVVRVSATEVKAFDATCPHQGAIVAEPSGGSITCPSHGSQFSPADGSVKKGPATAGLRAVAVKVDGGQVVLA